MEVDKLQLDVPIDAFLGEAEQVAEALARHRVRMVAGTGKALSSGVAAEIRRLVDEIRRSQRARAMPVPPVDGSAIARARKQIAEITAAIRFAAEFRHAPEMLAVLAKIRRVADPTSRHLSAVSLALREHVTLAQSYREQLKGLAGFTIPRERETEALAAEVLAIPRNKSSARALRRDQTQARNALVSELRAHVRAVRAAARFVFRAEPEIIREFTSALGRKRRRLARGEPKKTRAATSSAAEGTVVAPTKPIAP